jgi:hypothetical protein
MSLDIIPKSCIMPGKSLQLFIDSDTVQHLHVLMNRQLWRVVCLSVFWSRFRAW